jgi:hypothetical protein
MRGTQTTLNFCQIRRARVLELTVFNSKEEQERQQIEEVNIS